MSALPVHRASRSRRAWTVRAVAAAMLAVVVVALAVVLTLDDDDAGGPTSVPTSVGPSATTLPPPVTPTAEPTATPTSPPPTSPPPTVSVPTTSVPTTSVTPVTPTAADRTPPALTVTSPDRGAVVSIEWLVFTGTTEPGATVTAAGRYSVAVGVDGTWSVRLRLVPGANGAVFVARDRAGNETEVRLTVHYRPPIDRRVTGGSSLVPTGIAPVADLLQQTPFPLAADGQGALWQQGPWRITRVDSVTGAAATWGIGDDLAFAATQRIAGSPAGGVWLVSDRHVRLFDGVRFVLDLEVPQQYGLVTDLADDAVTLYVATTTAVVARRADGAWIRLADGNGGLVVVAGDGALWATQVRLPGDEPGAFAPARFDGATWTRPDAGSGLPTGTVAAVAAAPGSGVWALTAALGAAVHRFDGTSWQRTDVPSWLEEPRGVAATIDGELWVAGARVVGRLADGRWTQAAGAELPSVAATASAVFLSTGDGVARFDEAPTLLWRDAGRGPVAAIGMPLGVSADEVWIAAVTARQHSWWRFCEGRWSSVGPSGTTDVLVPAVLASDGAVWAATADGLVRFDDGTWTLAVPESDGKVLRLAAADAGSVWAVLGRADVVRVSPTGVVVPLGSPAADTSATVTRCAGAADGSVWAVVPADESWWLARGTDGWEVVALPEGLVPTDLSVTADGTVWLLGEYAEGGVPIVRYAGGQWQTTTLPSVHGHALAQAPDGSVCVASQGRLQCYGADGRSTSVTDVPVVGFVLVAPDGAVWVAGAQLVLLPTRVGG